MDKVTEEMTGLNLSLLKKIYVDRVVITLQLIIVLAVAIDYIFFENLIHGNPLAIISVLVVSTIVAITPILPTQKVLSFLVFAAIHFALGIFFIYVVPIGSPYILLNFVLLYFTTYWYGLRGFLASISTITFIHILTFINQIASPQTDDYYQLGLTIFMYLTIGGIVGRLHNSDLIERKVMFHTMQEASFEHMRLKSLINSMADAVVATDFEGKILVYNGAALNLLNTNDTLENKPLSNYLKTFAGNGKIPVDLIAQAKHEHKIIKRDDIVFKVKKGEDVNLYISVAQIQISYGEQGQEGFILLMRDITREKSIEEQRDEFISVVSHELRTPIAITEANISTALHPSIVNDGSRVKDLLQQAHQNVIFVSDMVNDITTLAHAERGDLEAELEEVEPSDLIKEVAATYKAEAAKKGLKLNTKADEGLPTLRSNNYRLKEILQNFATNAIKYTDEGTIVISAEKNDGGVRFSVTDSGIGMTLSDQKHVFEKFWRSEDFRTRTHKGTGLGLYISKKLADRMQAKVGVTSELNKGSTFYLDVPREFKVKSRTGGGSSGTT